MPSSNDPNDPKGLIREAYRIEGITLPECRSIFLDWALSLPAEFDQLQVLRELHAVYSPQAPEHPMTEVLSDGLSAAKAPKRRGGWKSRPRGHG